MSPRIWYMCVCTAVFALPPLWAQRPVIWHDPGNVSAFDFSAGPGGRSRSPKPPFRYVHEEESGKLPKLMVRDRDKRLWSVKWGPEARAEVFASRLAWASGYYVEPNFFVSSGRIYGVPEDSEARDYVSEDGRFENARFELRGANGRYLPKTNWTWDKNPFRGSPELNGLKVLLMLVSNWDNKDGRQRSGSNTGVFENGSGRNRTWTYMVTDWGASMGKWGWCMLRREKWNCEDFADQTKDFIKGVEDGKIQFGFSGYNSGRFKHAITPADVRWLLSTLGQVTDRQIRAGLRASGATPDEMRCFSASLRDRIRQLQAVSRRP